MKITVKNDVNEISFCRCTVIMEVNIILICKLPDKDKQFIISFLKNLTDLWWQFYIDENILQVFHQSALGLAITNFQGHVT